MQMEKNGESFRIVTILKEHFNLNLRAYRRATYTEEHFKMKEVVMECFSLSS